MKRSEIFNILVDRVCEECEVNRSDVLGPSRVQSVVAARVIAVQYLRRIGLSNDDIAEMVLRCKGNISPNQEEIKQKAKNIDKLFCSYSNYCLNSYAFCIMSKTIKEFCHEQYQGMYCEGMKQLSI